MTLKDKLAEWKLRNHVPFAHCDELLKILHEHHPELPLSTKTLVCTPRDAVVTIDVSPGKYFHYGIEAGIRQLATSMKIKNLDTPLKIFVGIDGVGVGKSTKSSFWVIVGYIPCFKSSPPFPIGIYHGYAKPDDPNLFLANLVEEAEGLHEIGLGFNDKCIEVRIIGFICDAPARAMITGTKGHTSKLQGCSRCDGHGITIGNLRTNGGFRRKIDREHHNFRSVIENLLYVDMVKDVPLDPMHLLDLGVMKRLLTFLFGIGGSIRRVTLNPATRRDLNKFLISLRKCISRLDFSRQPRTIAELKRWKATEFRLFLHYLGVVVFKGLSTVYYQHFLLLHVAVKLLSCQPWCFDDNVLANNLLSQFVRQASVLYSPAFVSHNIHSLFHLASDVARFGPLDSFSAYRFENHYGKLKRHLKKSPKPLEQLIKRLSEKKKRNMFSSQIPIAEPLTEPHITFTEKHRNGPMVPNCRGVQFQRAKRTGPLGVWEVSCESSKDNCVMLQDKSVVIVKNFVKVNGVKLVMGQKYLTQQNFYMYPIPSSSILEYVVSNLSPLQAWDVNDIVYKCVKLPVSYNNRTSFVVFPQLMQ